jgi:hypothetical protein
MPYTRPRLTFGKSKRWKLWLRDSAAGAASAVRAQDDLTASLYQKIGQLKVELDWLKKTSSWE